MVKRPHSHKWVDAHSLYKPRAVMILDLVAGSRELERREAKRNRGI